MLLLNIIVPEAVAPWIKLTFNDEFNLSRFGGFFLNAHFNAFFIATALIYYGYKNKFYGTDLAIIYITGSKFILISYFSNLIEKNIFLRVKNKFVLTIIIISVMIIVLFMIINYNDLINFLVNESSGVNTTSLVIILMQIFDPAYYNIFLNLLPSEILNVTAYSTVSYNDLDHDGHIEIGYMYLACQFGMILGIFFLFMLLRNAFYFRIMILVSLLHGVFIISPLINYMFLIYTRDIREILRASKMFINASQKKNGE
jgi:hypothetical protein